MSDIILWGASQVGKTTALATYFCHRPPSWLDVRAPASQKTLVELGGIWNRLQRNQLPGPSLKWTYYETCNRQGSTLRFRDMVGGNAENVAGQDLDELLKAAGVLLFLSWPGDGRTDGVIAVHNALRQIGRDQRPVALVLTKAETYLRADQLARFRIEDPLEIARDLGVAGPFRDLLRDMPPAAIFPVTVYGYSPQGHPAHYLDELGRLVPWHVRPHFVDLPFNYVLEGLTA